MRSARLRSACASAQSDQSLRRSHVPSTVSRLSKEQETRALAIPLRKHAYSNIFRLLPPKNENFQMKYSGSFHISAQNTDCGYLLEPSRPSGSNEYPQSMFLSRNKKNNVYPCKSKFYCILKWGLRGSKLYRRVFVMLGGYTG